MNPHEIEQGTSSQDLVSACQESLPPEIRMGLEMFNQGHYFEAHEALETGWRAEPGSIRNLYQGILQVGVAYYHIQRGNYSGALKLFKRCSQWLDPFPPICRGINIGQLKDDYKKVETELIRLGPERITLFNLQLLRPIELFIIEE